MRVLLIYSNRSRIIEPVPPIGLSYVATATRSAGHEVRFLDLMVSRNPGRDLDEALSEFCPEVVGISVRNIDSVIAQDPSWQLGEAADLIARIRKTGNRIVVLGGPAISVLKSRALEILDADFAVIGEGESAFPGLLRAIGSGSGFSSIPGLSYRAGGRIQTNPAELQKEFGPSGMENWTRWKEYDRSGGPFAIHTKRGCALHCLYCNYPSMEGRTYRCRDAADVVDEIERVQKAVNPRTFEFTDTTFNLPTAHASAICEEIIRRNLKVKLSAVGMNPLGVTEEMLRLMKRAGFISMIVSADAGNEAMLRNLHKGFHLEDVTRAAGLIRASGIHSTWFFLLGGPGETEATVRETLAFAEAYLNYSRCLTIVMTGIRILPGTPLAESLQESGSIPPDADLSAPAFYFAPGLSERRVLDLISESIRRCPTIVHGGEQGGSTAERLFYRAIQMAGGAPPYMRFLPQFLSLPFVPQLRAAQPGCISETKAGVYLVS